MQLSPLYKMDPEDIVILVLVICACCAMLTVCCPPMLCLCKQVNLGGIGRGGRTRSSGDDGGAAVASSLGVI